MKRGLIILILKRSGRHNASNPIYIVSEISVSGTFRIGNLWIREFLMGLHFVDMSANFWIEGRISGQSRTDGAVIGMVT